jgi:hypothetical protein
MRGVFGLLILLGACGALSFAEAPESASTQATVAVADADGVVEAAP